MWVVSQLSPAARNLFDLKAEGIEIIRPVR